MYSGLFESCPSSTVFTAPGVERRGILKGLSISLTQSSLDSAAEPVEETGDNSRRLTLGKDESGNHCQHNNGSKDIEKLVGVHFEPF
jgi:hypothetical protein